MAGVALGPGAARPASVRDEQPAPQLDHDGVEPGLGGASCPGRAAGDPELRRVRRRPEAPVSLVAVLRFDKPAAAFD